VKASRKTIISCALTGSIHVPSMSPALPFTPEQLAEQGKAAAAAGAAILHLHARDPREGSPSADPDVFLEFVPGIAAASDVVINISTGGSTRMTTQQRLAPALRLKPEVASLNMGSMNFNFSGAAARVKDWKYDWEREYLLGSGDVIFANTFKQIEYSMRELGDGCGTRFEFECYDIGHLYSLAHFVERGLVQPPFLIQGVFGVLGGIGADSENLTHMVSIADKLFGDDYVYSAFAAGRSQMAFATHSLILGGNVRVGLEDNLYIGPGSLASSNAEQVSMIRSVIESLGREIATPREAREMLNLKGRNEVGF
jgi:uncharacterized protein (DUF849 family)